MSSIYLSDEQWEILWLVNTAMTFKISEESEKQTEKYKKMIATNGDAILEINRKLDLILKRLDEN